MIDSHTHLNISPLIDDPATYYWNAKNAGVTGMMLVGTDIASSEIAAKLTSVFDICFASVGIHPEEAGKTSNNQLPILNELEEMLKGQKVLAIGECGLDYHYDGDHEAQKELFRLQRDLAIERRLPLIIHCRDAYDDLLAVLKETAVPRFVLHCASGPVSYIQEALSMGAYVSFAGNVTYPSAGNIRELLKVVPLDRLLVETDAPFLPPQTHRGQTNEPAFVIDTAKFIAEFLGTSFEEIDTVTTANAQELFDFSGISRGV